MTATHERFLELLDALARSFFFPRDGERGRMLSSFFLPQRESGEEERKQGRLEVKEALKKRSPIHQVFSPRSAAPLSQSVGSRQPSFVQPTSKKPCMVEPHRERLAAAKTAILPSHAPLLRSAASTGKEG